MSDKTAISKSVLEAISETQFGYVTFQRLLKVRISVFILNLKSKTSTSDMEYGMNCVD